MQRKDIEQRGEYYLDITADVCPMTFVRARLLVESMGPAQIAVIRLRGEEPLANVPASLVELGHTIESLAPEAPGAKVHLLRVRTKS